MKHPIRTIFIVMVALFVYLTCDAFWGVSSKWQTNEVLSLWQMGITGLALIAAVIMIKHAVSQFEYGRKRDEETRKESLSQIKHSLKSELELNRHSLTGGEYKIWRENRAIGIRPLKTSAFELLAGREDLKYLTPPEALTKIAEAYNQIKDFNSVLNSWIRRALFGEEKGSYSFEKGRYSLEGTIDLSLPTTKQLDEEKRKTIEKIDEALKLL